MNNLAVFSVLFARITYLPDLEPQACHTATRTA